MLEHKIEEVIFSLVTQREKNYIEDCLSTIRSSYNTHFIRLFSTLNRHLSAESKSIMVSIPSHENDQLIIENWELSKLVRVLFLLQISEDDAEKYFDFVDSLFHFATIEELNALYASLNTLHHPEKWISRCAEGIRSNIGTVQQAVILHNKYPFRYLNETAWNQMILKGFFTNLNIVSIYGVFERVNDKLASAAVDFIFERDSAKRPINPFLWYFASKVLNERSIEILIHQFEQEDSHTAKNIMLYALKESTNQMAEDFYQKESANGYELDSWSDVINELK